MEQLTSVDSSRLMSSYTLLAIRVTLKEKMKFTFYLALAVLGCAVTVDSLTTAYDNVNIERLLRNERVCDAMIKCLLGTGRCSNDGRELKKSLPSLLKEGGKNCNEKQIAMAKTAGRYMKENRPRDLVKLLNKYDPHHQYRSTFEEFIADE